MKNKFVIIILCVIFVVGLLIINHMLKSQQDSLISAQNENIKEDKMSVLEITSNNFEKEVLESEKTVLVDFYADWCGPCKMLSPIVEQVAEENENIKVCRVNIDEEQDLAVEYGIMSIPTLVVIKNGEEEKRSVGVVEKEEIVEMVK